MYMYMYVEYSSNVNDDWSALHGILILEGIHATGGIMDFIVPYVCIDELKQSVSYT